MVSEVLSRKTIRITIIRESWIAIAKDTPDILQVYHNLEQEFPTALRYPYEFRVKFVSNYLAMPNLPPPAKYEYLLPACSPLA